MACPFFLRVSTMKHLLLSMFFILSVLENAPLIGQDFVLSPKKSQEQSSRSALKQEIGAHCQKIFNRSISLLKTIGQIQADVTQDRNEISIDQTILQTRLTNQVLFSQSIASALLDLAQIQDYASRIVIDLVEQGPLFKNNSKTKLEEHLTQLKKIYHRCKSGAQEAQRLNAQSILSAQEHTNVKLIASHLKSARSSFEQCSVFTQKTA